MKKLLSSILIVVFLMFMVAVPVPVCAADRENFSVGNLDVQKSLELKDAGVIKYLGTGVNWTLTKEESRHIRLRASSGNGARSIINPYAKAGTMHYVSVETGGVQMTSITIRKTLAGNGVTIAVGYGAWVWFDGTRYRRMTASSLMAD
jgi:hypothetical protein